MGKIIVVTKYVLISANSEDEIEIFKNGTGKKLRIYKIIYTGGTEDESKLNVYLKIGEMRVYPYAGSLYNIGGTKTIDADVELDPNSTLKLYYKNTTTTDYETSICIVAEVVE